MAQLPIYDDTYPCIVLPFENIHSESKRYLGRQALTGKVYATLNWILQTDIDIQAVHDFWRLDCNYGLQPFILPAPLFGNNPANVEFIARFVGDFSPTKGTDGIWNLKMQVRILAPFTAIRDDNGDYVYDDNGDIVYSDSSLHSSADNIITFLKLEDITL